MPLYLLQSIYSSILISFHELLSIYYSVFSSLNFSHYYFLPIYFSQVKVWPSTSSPPVSSYNTEEERVKLVDYLQVRHTVLTVQYSMNSTYCVRLLHYKTTSPITSLSIFLSLSFLRTPTPPHSTLSLTRSLSHP